MPFSDLREFLEAAQSLGEVKAINGADWNLEIGCITEIMAEKEGPLLVFDAIPGYPRGFRIATNFLATPRRFALALGLPLDIPKLEMLKLWKDRSPGVKLLPYQEIPSAPVTQNVLEGADVDLEKFPAPKWHELDGGRYIGTADLVVLKDPDSDWVNVGTYRGCIYNRDRLTLWIGDSKHGKLIARRYWARGEACPVAVVLGCEPVTWLAGPSRLKVGVCEYDYAGGLRGAPVEVIRGSLTGLPVPASSEIVLEGEIPPLEVESAAEGPFGEWPGYYTHMGQETVVRVKSVMYRDNPILLGNPPLLPTTVRYGIPLFAARVWELLESAGVGDIQGVWFHCHTLMIAISLRQRRAGQAMQALTAAAGLSVGADMYRYFVTVDEDIDPSDLSQVVWALCTRVDPSESVQILHSWTSDLDPRLAPSKRSQGDYTAGRVLIDACKPFHWRDRFPATNRFNQGMRKQVWEKWMGQLLGG